MQDRLISCERCDQAVVTPFRLLLAELARESRNEEYALAEAVHCPGCSGIIEESTLVSFRNLPVIPADAEYFDPPLENATIFLVDEEVRTAAENLIAGCEQCADCMELSFECILDQITGFDPRYTDYLLCGPARCPRCHQEINERTLVISRR